MSELFDIAETRRGLMARRDELLLECDANNKLQRQFDRISSQLSASSKEQKSNGSPSFASQEKALNDLLSDTDYLLSNPSSQDMQHGFNPDTFNGDNNNDMP